MRKLNLLAAIIFTLTLNISHAQTNDTNPRFAIHLLDYLAHDYSGAVVHGKVASESEYAEQKEFVTKVFELTNANPTIASNKSTSEKISKLKKMIESKAEAVDVALLARDIQKDLITITQIKLSPLNQPSITNGKNLFQQNCIACHGQNGLGDGPDGAKLDPKPANFHSKDRMSSISAFHSFNTIRLGVPGTGMPAFGDLSDRDVWDLSFYVMSLRHQTFLSTLKTIPANQLNFSLEEMATLSDTELKEKIAEKITDKKTDQDEQNKNIALALLRTKNDDTSSGQYIGIAKSLLTKSLVSFKSNNKDEAKRFALQAYLEGIEPIEPMIKANNPQLVVQIEKEMGKIRQIISSGNDTTPETIEKLAAQIIITQNVFSEVLESVQSQELSPSVAFSGAFAIILREGFEAVLIILTLLSVIKAFGNKQAAFWVHAGWSSALTLGFVAWFLSGFLMKLSGAGREMLEAITSSFAVVVLLYFGFWLHRQTEISRWKQFIQEKVQGAIDNKNLFGLFSIAFISVFREAFETVLFIRALWFQSNGDGKNAIGMGLIAALGLIFMFSFVALRYSKKLPIRELFKVSSFLTSALAFILAGKAVHSLQEAGVLSSTGLPWNLRFDTIGLFPTWQTVTAQFATLAFAILLLNLNSNKKPVVVVG